MSPGGDRREGKTIRAWQPSIPEGAAARQDALYAAYRPGRGGATLRRVAAQYDAVFHHVHGRDCGRPFTYVISPSVTKAGPPTPEVNLAAEVSE